MQIAENIVYAAPHSVIEYNWQNLRTTCNLLIGFIRDMSWCTLITQDETLINILMGLDN